jgi:hypothetical protein
MIRFLVVAFFALSTFAQTTPILIPVFYNGPGQRGSDWFTSVTYVYSGTTAIPGHGLRVIDRTCPIPEGCERFDIAPNSFGAVAGPESVSGFLLHVPLSEVDRFVFDARFGERTRNKYGVEMPVARESDFKRTPTVLPIVALGGTFADNMRTTLRIYSPDALPGQTVRVDLSPWGSPATVGSKIVRLELSDPPGTATPLRPAFAQLELQREFPGLFGTAVTVRVTPIAPVPDAPPPVQLPRVWAFATAVRNDNNEVAVYSPR